MTDPERSPAELPEADLQALDDAVEAALAAGDESGLRVLGYGEISLVLGWPAERPEFACKRLPVFGSRARFDAYSETLGEYVTTLRECGVDALATELRGVERPDGSVAGYAVQAVLDAATLGPAVLRAADPAAGHPLIGAIVAAAERVIMPRRGLDAQLANWAWDDSGAGEPRLRYLDVTTPMLWDTEGAVRLDTDLLVQPLPGPMRAPIRRFVAPGILDTYREPRKAFFDLTGNLIKERLEGWLPAFLDEINRVLDEPISRREVERYYARDKRLWEVLLRLRKLDRAWVRRVRRRTYPFLLPRDVDR